MCFDTTSSNTGGKSGACVLLQNLLGRNLMKFACRHHIYELILRCVFELKLTSSSAPEVQIFERFAKAWPDIDKTRFASGLDDEGIRSSLPDDICNDIKAYCRDQLSKSHSRDDYRELLQLTMAFLGENIHSFRAPGPTSNARWMAKAIYSFKISLFRDQFHLTPRELKGLAGICIFLVRLYIKAWFSCTNAISAPNLDFNFIKNVIAYASIDPKVSEAVLKKIRNHCWYLSKELIAFSFFDTEVSNEEKRKMIERLQYSEPVVKLESEHKIVSPEILLNHTLSDFVSSNTEMFFARIGISLEFLISDPITWETNKEYQDGLKICRQMSVTNDSAERGVKFMKDYNRILTNDEEEKQLLLQIVEAYRRKYPTYKKSSLT